MKDNVILNLRNIDNSKVVDDDFPPTVPNLGANTFSGIPTNAIHPTTSRQSKGRDIFCHIETNGFLYISQALRVEFFKSNNLWLLENLTNAIIGLITSLIPAKIRTIRI